MKIQNIYLPIKVMALFSFISIGVKYWGPSEVGFYLLLSPYFVLYFFSNEHNYRNKKLTLIRFIPAAVTLLLVPVLLFGIQPDAQAGIALMVYLTIQLSSITLAELIIMFVIKEEAISKLHF